MKLPAQFALIAEAPPANPPKRTEPFLQKTEDWVGVGLLVGALLAGAVIIMVVDRWRKSAMGGSPREGALQLTEYREMFERGEITTAEYEKLRLKVAASVKPPVVPPAPPDAPERKPPA